MGFVICLLQWWILWVCLLQKSGLCNNVCLVSFVIHFVVCLLQKLRLCNNVHVMGFIHHYSLLSLLFHICFHCCFIFAFIFFFYLCFHFFSSLHSLFFYIFFHFFFFIHLHSFFLSLNFAGISLLQTTPFSFFSIIIILHLLYSSFHSLTQW